MTVVPIVPSVFDLRLESKIALSVFLTCFYFPSILKFQQQSHRAESIQQRGILHVSLSAEKLAINSNSGSYGLCYRRIPLWDTGRTYLFFLEVREIPFNTGFAFNEGLNSWGEDGRHSQMTTGRDIIYSLLGSRDAGA